MINQASIRPAKTFWLRCGQIALPVLATFNRFWASQKIGWIGESKASIKRMKFQKNIQN